MTGTWGLERSPAAAMRSVVDTEGGAAWSQASPRAASSSWTIRRSQQSTSESAPANASQRPEASKARSLTMPVQAGNVSHGFKGQSVAEDDAPIAPTRGQQPPVGAERERLDRLIVPLGEAMDDPRSGSDRAITAPSESPMMTRLVRLSTTSRLQPAGNAIAGADRTAPDRTGQPTRSGDRRGDGGRHLKDNRLDIASFPLFHDGGSGRCRRRRARRCRQSHQRQAGGPWGRRPGRRHQSHGRGDSSAACRSAGPRGGPSSRALHAGYRRPLASIEPSAL